MAFLAASSAKQNASKVEADSKKRLEDALRVVDFSDDEFEVDDTVDESE